MPSLADLQRHLAAAVRNTAAAGEDLGIEPAGLTAERRLAVYRNHHRISLGAALAANFPTVPRVIGAKAFRALAEDFIAFSPPLDSRLGAYGAMFADFLARDSRLTGLPYLADLARLDWALNRAECAADAPSFGAEHLAALAEKGNWTIRLSPHPSLSLIASRYSLMRIRDLAGQPAAAAPDVSLKDGGVDIMVWRRDAVPTCMALDPAIYRFTSGLAAGVPLDEAASGLDADRLVGALAEVVAAGAFMAPFHSAC